MSGAREGNLEAPRRAPIDWKNPEFWDPASLEHELERVFDICHGCRRCVSLCESFPVLFNLVDESPTLEVDGVAKADYAKVVDQCFMCDLCAETKCPYLPPHEWAIDFPHLMLRAKAQKFARGEQKWRDRLITSTDRVFPAIGLPGVAGLANAAAASPTLRAAGERVAGIHRDAPLPRFNSRTAKDRLPGTAGDSLAAVPAGRTRGRVALYVTCYGNWNEPDLVEDLVAVFNHNGIAVEIIRNERCCGMPKFELGDLKAVEQMMEANIPRLLDAVERGCDLIAPVPSCVLMFRQELPLMFPDDPRVQKVRGAFFDPFEYLHQRHRAGLLKTDFRRGLGKVAYHMACHQRVQNIGQRTAQVLKLIPDTEVVAIDRCSGHDGTYAVRSETYDKAMKIAKPVVDRVRKATPDHYGSDCPMAGRLIEHGLDDASRAQHPLTMLRHAYAI